MKKTAKIATIVFLIFSILFSLEPVALLAETDYEIDMPQRLDVSEEETSFTVTLLSELSDGTTISVKTMKDPRLTNNDGETVELNVKLSASTFRKKGDSITVTLTHEKLDESVWELDFELSFVPVKKANKNESTETILEDTQANSSAAEAVYEPAEIISEERKTMYGIQTVSEWNTSDYSLEKPEGPYKEFTQYATETAEFSESSYSLDAPADGICQSATQYGYETRSKTEVSTPHTYPHSYGYNNIGACPADCIAGTQNDYGTGCECRIQTYITEYKTSYNYGQWALDESSYRFNDAYEESDTIRPVSRTVYLTPVSFQSNEDWSYEEKSSTATSRVITRTVYCSPLSYNEAVDYSDNAPEVGNDAIVVTKEFCRIIRNGNPEAWKECD